LANGDPSDGGIAPCQTVRDRHVARYDLVLATGHLSAAESIVVIKAAKAAGVKRILVTHVLSPALHATPADLAEMVRLGAMLEFVWLAHYVAPTTANVRFPGPSRPPLPLERCVEAIRAVGAEHIVLASDFGQQGNPPPPDGLRAFAAELHQAGISAQQLDLMLRQNPARLLGLAAAW
jgi:microsomal dipeptidase-like Zn-dependent dipeptidase